MSGCGKLVKKGRLTLRCGAPLNDPVLDADCSRALCSDCGGDWENIFARASTKGEPQPDTKKKGRVVITELIADLEARSEVGQVKYGQRLRSNNGRNCLMDAYQECLDLAMYLKQMLIEQEENGE